LQPRAAAALTEAWQLLAQEPSPDSLLLDHSLVTPESIDAGALFGATPMWVLAPPQERLLRAQLAGRPHTHFLTKPCTLPALWNSLDADALAPRETPLQPTLPAPAAPTPVSVLVVEDNLVNQKVVMRVLERAGCAVSIAHNGVEAVAAVHSGRFAVVFMDIQMPEMDGLEATSAIRRLPAPVDQPYIIALTAAVAEVDRARCLAAGMNDFVSKPARTEDLSAALHRALAARNQPAPA
jgi:CheY-like chemotaxis protein